MSSKSESVTTILIDPVGKRIAGIALTFLMAFLVANYLVMI